MLVILALLTLIIYIANYKIVMIPEHNYCWIKEINMQNKDNILCHVWYIRNQFEVTMIILHMHTLFMNNVIQQCEYRPQSVVVSQGLWVPSLIPRLSAVWLVEAVSTIHTAKSLDTRLAGTISSIFFLGLQVFHLHIMYYVCAYAWCEHRHVIPL